MSAWTPGASGNKRGRPPKGRALTEILEKAGSRTIPHGDQKLSRKKILAEMLWEGAINGKVTLPYDPALMKQREMVLDGDDWFDVVKFLYAHIDGPPKTGLLDSLPEDRNIEIKLIRTEGRKASTQEADDSATDA
jgi:hypothetical protein